MRNADGQALLSGPEYPSPNPLAFNGQGLPEVFRFDEKWEGLPTTSDGQEALIIGVGRARSENTSINIGNAVVYQAVQWDISADDTSMEFCCEDAWQDWSYRLKRSLVIDGTSISVENELRNKGSKILPLHWYIHLLPFE